jgi:DNA-binding CsgD family transcriptional regulator
LRKRSFREQSAVAATKGNRSDYLANGLDYKQIADQINVGIHTVRNYIRRIYEKLHVRTRTEAVAKFLRK